MENKVVERRRVNYDRRKTERRKQLFHCVQCGNELKNYPQQKLSDKEIKFCEHCQQMYVIVSQRIEIPYLAKVKK